MNQNITVTQVLNAGAMHYAENVIIAAIGKPQPGSNALEALDRARRILIADAGMPSRAAAERWGFLKEPLRRLQMAAVMFTVQIAISEGHDDPSTLPQIGDKLVALLEKDAHRIFHVHDDIAAAEYLADRGLDYVRQIIIAEDSGAPVGSEAVERSITDLQVAAVALTAQLAISEGHDPKAMRQIESKLIEMLTEKKS